MSKYDFDLNLEDRNSLSVLISRIKPNSIVLEFGPAHGRMTKYLKEELECKIYAVELDEKAAKDAKKFTEKIVVDSIENYTWKEDFKDIKFDFIIFADVLEHLYDPQKVLEEVKEFLKEDGSILVSIPNIAHNAIIIDLLQNEFNYHPTGLLDNTHIRFFTKKTFDELVERVGYFRCYESAIYNRPENTEFGNSYDMLPSEVAKYLEKFEYGEVYQLVYQLKKEKCELESDYKSYNIPHNFIQLFIDEGKGFSEGNSIKYPVNRNNDIQEFLFNLSKRNGIKALRLDPLDDYVVLEVVETEVDGESFLEKINSNALYQDGSIFYFDTIDAQFYIDLENIQSLFCKFRYLYMGRDALIEVDRLNQKILIEKDHNIKQLEKLFYDREEQLHKKNLELVKLQEKNKALETLAESLRMKNRIKKVLGIGMVSRAKKIYEYLLIKFSNDFDTTYYLEQNPDIKKSSISPLKHFCNYGWKEGRNPSREFDVQFYLSTYDDVRKSGMNPLFHYVRHGKREGRKINEKGVILRDYSFVDKLFFLLKDAKEKPYLVSKFIYELRQNGIQRTIAKTKFFLRKNLTVSEVLSENKIDNSSEKIKVIPYYIDLARGKKVKELENNLSLAIHVHITSIDLFIPLLKSLKPFEHLALFLSVAKGIDSSEIESIVKSEVKGTHKVVIENVPSDLDAIASLVVLFGKELLTYDYIGHFHTESNTTLLLDEAGVRSGEVLLLLSKKAKIVFGQDPEDHIKDPSGWYDNKAYAKTILEKYMDIQIDDFPVIDFPYDGMFWAKSASLERLLKLPLSFDDFILDKQLSKVLKQLLLVFASSYDGDNYCIYDGDTLRDYKYYEEQKDFSDSIVHDDVKVLSYYLGQFHPIPENDEWHGKGFTEWTNVKSCYPLYKGHYQQHIPHEDMGYYILDNPDILRKQADMMKKSGVYGQIFYHYWFTGKLILEKPVQMLLKHKDIDTPFCFCWANENWTKRWDGNEAEILLGQEYSPEDARAFIQYLIPFFQDERYIKVDGRPMLYVYRPSSIPNEKEYIDIWKEECEKAGLKAPYVIAVLTRGAVNPEEHFMDAGVERILHDWTGGAVPDIKNTLKQYHPMIGSVLSYDEVATFYESQMDEKEFTYFRSISPMWDNTARYKEGAILLDSSTPYRFQKWFEQMITFTKRTLPQKERFLIVNAWNEWAEGAHLEPDSYHGYAYLNSIGRALSNIPYAQSPDVGLEIPQNSKINIVISDRLNKELAADRELSNQFLKCLENATLFSKRISIVSEHSLLKPFVKGGVSDQDCDFTILFQKAAIFDEEVLEKLVQTAKAFSSSKIVANCYDKNIYEITQNGSVDAAILYDAPIVVYQNKYSKNVRMRTDAKCFLSPVGSVDPKEIPEVTTIIRFHKSASFNELRNALFSLAAMRDVKVSPLIAAQDLDERLKEKLQSMIRRIPLKYGTKISLRYFESENGEGDLRTVMLNESLKSVTTKFAAFLDYDDFLFPDAYTYLTGRIQKIGKAIAFGRVYETSYDHEKEVIVKREKKYEYGYSYDDFLGHNLAPLHSFMIDTEKVDLSNIVYYEDQRYMEDYLLTLQLFTKENADWEGLADNVYIGDYIHSMNRGHTLAFNSDEERTKLLDDPEYQKDDKRIDQMRRKMM